VVQERADDRSERENGQGKDSDQESDPLLIDSERTQILMELKEYRYVAEAQEYKSVEYEEIFA
jgi:hypothetical protein